jgi:hypothetical protein
MGDKSAAAWPNGRFQGRKLPPTGVSEVTLRSEPSDIIVGFEKQHGKIYTGTGYLTGRRVTLNTRSKSSWLSRNPRTIT